MEVSFESALRVIAEVVPAEVTVEAIAVVAADTEKVVAQSGTGLLETMLVDDDIDTVDQQENTDSEEVVMWLAGWVKAQAACNNEVVVWFGSQLGVELEMTGVQAVAGRQLDEKGQELAAGYADQMMQEMHYQFFSVLWKQEGKISPHSTASGLRKVILSEQVEVWLILSESQLALVCLLKFVVTCVLPACVCQEI